MISIGKGQAIIGGKSGNDGYQKKVYFMECSNNICNILMLKQELSIPRAHFVAVAIPDTIADCITAGKIVQKIIYI